MSVISIAWMPSALCPANVWHLTQTRLRPPTRVRASALTHVTGGASERRHRAGDQLLWLQPARGCRCLQSSGEGGALGRAERVPGQALPRRAVEAAALGPQLREGKGGEAGGDGLLLNLHL